jgi:hypothetical protein
VGRRAAETDEQPARPRSPRDLYRDECAKVAAGDPRWRRRGAPEQCSCCDAFSSWLAPDGRRTCPGCWDWLSDAGADALPALEPPRVDPKLPPGAAHPKCPKCPPGDRRPAYDWGWDSRGKNRKRALLASCSSCGAALGAVDRRTFAAFAPPEPPGEPGTADLFAAPAVDPDDAAAVGADALDVAGTREAQVARADSAAGRLRLRVPVVTTGCSSCGAETRGVLWPAGMSAGDGLESRGAGAVCAACAELEALERGAPMGLTWAREVATGAVVLAPVEEVGWRHEGDYPHEPLGYRGARWADFRDRRAALAERRRAPRAPGILRDAVDAVTGAPMSAADVSAYLRAVAEAGLDRWAVGRFACGAVTEIKRGSSK